MEQMDVMLLIGQSNAKGCGDPEKSPLPLKNHYEFVENMTGCAVIPMGVTLQCSEGRGTLAPGFALEWTRLTGHSLCVVHGAVDGSRIKNWVQDEHHYLEEMATKLEHGIQHLKAQGWEIGHVFALWVQGESDAKYGTDPLYYAKRLQEIGSLLTQRGVEQVFVSATGYWNIGQDVCKRCERISAVQQMVCETSSHLTLASTLGRTFLKEGLQRDPVHYSMKGLSLLGQDIAKHIESYYNKKQEKPKLEDRADLTAARRYLAGLQALEQEMMEG